LRPPEKAWVLAATAGALGATGTFVSCIADLPPDGPAPVSAPSSTCGDGIIDLTHNEECDPGPAATEAGARGCSADCKVQCPGGFKWAGNDHCYTLAQGVAATFSSTGNNSATSVCANQPNGHVVTFASDDEFAAVEGYAEDAGADLFWVGIWAAQSRYVSVAPDEPGWSPACPGCYAYTPTPDAELPKLALAGDASGCVMADVRRTSWLQAPCVTLQRARAICESEPTGHHFTSCDGGGDTCIDLVLTHGRKRYVFVNRTDTAADAEAFCATLGGSLVVLESRDEREQLWRELVALGVSQAWIGLSRSDAGVWTWSDGTGPDASIPYPPPWAILEPAAGTHAYLDHRPGIDDSLAHSTPAMELPYVCQIPLSDGGP
jgi:hypothetical protein